MPPKMASKEDSARSSYLTNLALNAASASALSNIDLRRQDLLGKLTLAPVDAKGYSYRDLVMLNSGGAPAPALVGQVSWAQFKVV